MDDFYARNAGFNEQLFSSLAPTARMLTRVLQAVRLNVSVVPGLLTASFGIGSRGSASARCTKSPAPPLSKLARDGRVAHQYALPRRETRVAPLFHLIPILQEGGA